METWALAQSFDANMDDLYTGYIKKKDWLKENLSIAL